MRVQQMQSFKQISRPTHHFEPGLFRGRVSHLAGRRPDEMAACAENAGMPVISVCLIYERRRDNYVMILLNQLCLFYLGMLTFLLSYFSCFTGVIFDFMLFLLLCLCAIQLFLSLCFFAYPSFPASLLFCFSCFFAFLLFCFSFFLFLCFSAFCHFFFFAATASPPLCFSPFLSFLCSASLLMYACCCALPPISPRFLMFWTM